jgi:SAM-dependent methyltransferase
VASQSGAAAAWDAEYAAGRYSCEPPVAFTGDILAAARQAGLTRGLYIGCGNGRNYLPLVAGGLDLTGVDISAAAIAQLAARAPDRADRLVCGDLGALPAAAAYPVVIGIQVFQHGDRAAAHAHIRARAAAPGPRRPVLPAGQRHRHRHLAPARRDRAPPRWRAYDPLPHRP